MIKQNKPKKYQNHTSVSIKLQHRQILEKKAQKHNVSVNDLMILLLRFMSEKAFALNVGQVRIRYQMPTGDMQIVNLYIDQRDYERNLDARRYGKVSVSWLLAYAIDHFLDLIIKKIDKSVEAGKEILNNCVGLQTFRVKKLKKRIRFVSIWYPKQE